MQEKILCTTPHRAGQARASASGQISTTERDSQYWLMGTTLSVLRISWGAKSVCTQGYYVTKYTFIFVQIYPDLEDRVHYFSTTPLRATCDSSYVEPFLQDIILSTAVSLSSF